tara:strand:+ start:1487 stop:1987 length:501 start_codon:yes stop_codon:yes gene_type:complete
LVVIDPQRATSIFHIDETEIESIRAFRELLEEQAARNAFAGDKVAFARSIGAVLEKMNAALQSGDRTEYRLLDAEFHDVILSYGNNPYLTAAYNLIATKIGALRTRAQDFDNVVNNSLKTHARLHGLIESGDVEQFCKLLRLHIDNTGNDYLKWMTSQNAEAAEIS